MPIRRKRSYGRKRRTPRRTARRTRKRSTGRVARVYRPMKSGFSPSVNTIFSFYKEATVTNGGYVQYTANGLYDIDGSIHQPAGFDQYMDVYHRYFVTYFKVTCMFMNNSATLTPDIYMLITDATTPDFSTYSHEHLASLPDCVYTGLTYGGGSKNVGRLKLRGNVTKLLGRPADPAQRYGTVSANPVDKCILWLIFRNNTSGSVKYHLKIKFWTILSDPASLIDVVA